MEGKDPSRWNKVKDGMVKDIMMQQKVVDRLEQRREKNQIENDFLHRVQSNQVFLKLISLMSKRTGLSIRDVNALVEELCRLCWSEAQSMLATSAEMAPVRSMQAELDRAKQQIKACNLSAQKQIVQLKNAAPEDDDVVFHEPLQYLDDGTKDLVLSLVLDKVKLVEGGNAPPSLIELLKNRAERRAAAESSEMTLEVAVEKLQEAREELKDMRANQADTEEVVSVLKKQLREANQSAPETQKDLHELRRNTLKHQEEIGSKDATIAELRAANKDLEHEARKLRRESASLQALYSMHQNRQKGSGSKDEAGAVRTCVVQTDMVGHDIVDQQANLRKSKIMLEELQMKVKELVERCKQHGLDMDEVHKITEEVGLQEVVTCTRPVFQRLYEDAFRRAEKLDRIRAQLRAHGNRTLEAATSAKDKKRVRRLLVDENGEVPVLQAVEDSALEGLQQIWADSQHPRPSLESPKQTAPSVINFTAPLIALPAAPDSLRNASNTPANLKRGKPLSKLQEELDDRDKVSSMRYRREDAQAFANAARAVSKLKQETSQSLPVLPASRVAAQRLQAANAPLERVMRKQVETRNTSSRAEGVMLDRLPQPRSLDSLI